MTMTLRQRVLEQTAERINPSLLASPAAMQSHLVDQQILQGQFNAAVMVLDANGLAEAEMPQGLGRTGLSLMDRDFAQAALRRGQAAFGSPVSGRVPSSAVIHIATPIRNAQGQVIGAMVGITDMSQPSFLDMISNGSYGTTGGYLLADPKTRRIITASDKSRILEQLPATGANHAIDQFLSGYEGNPDDAQHTPFALELDAVRPDGSTRSCIARGQVELGANQLVVRLYGSLQDVTEARQALTSVGQLAFKDALTGLPNRRLLTDRMRQTLLTNKRSGHYAAAMYLDLDNFKPLNNRHGHAAGDQLLIEVANRLHACVREMDTVACIGGDEFVVRLSELDTDAQASGIQAGAVAEKIRASLAETSEFLIRQEFQMAP